MKRQTLITCIKDLINGIKLGEQETIMFLSVCDLIDVYEDRTLKALYQCLMTLAVNRELKIDCNG